MSRPIIGPFSLPPAGLKQGGARNRADRVSWQLSERQCRLLLDRSHDAWEAGLPLNRFITLAWGKAGKGGCEATQATGKFIKTSRDWMRWHGHSMPWVWVQEHGNTFGQHAHVLLHVPAELDLLFRPMPLRWGKSFLKGGYVAGTIQSQRLASAYTHDVNPELYRAVMLGKLHYMLKCSPAHLEGALCMTGWGHKPWGQSSRVVGKRAGVWQRSYGGGVGQSLSLG